MCGWRVGARARGPIPSSVSLEGFGLRFEPGEIVRVLSRNRWKRSKRCLLQRPLAASEAVEMRGGGWRCRDGCSRPDNAEIGFTGRGPSTYNVCLGGRFRGQRLKALSSRALGEERILDALTPLIQQYARQRKEGEAVGDFVV